MKVNHQWFFSLDWNVFPETQKLCTWCHTKALKSVWPSVLSSTVGLRGVQAGWSGACMFAKMLLKCPLGCPCDGKNMMKWTKCGDAPSSLWICHDYLQAGDPLHVPGAQIVSFSPLPLKHPKSSWVYPCTCVYPWLLGGVTSNLIRVENFTWAWARWVWRRQMWKWKICGRGE